jgi:hypothetical protein
LFLFCFSGLLFSGFWSCVLGNCSHM